MRASRASWNAWQPLRSRRVISRENNNAASRGRVIHHGVPDF